MTLLPFIAALTIEPPACALEWIDLEETAHLLALEVMTATITLGRTSCEPSSRTLSVVAEGSAFEIDLAGFAIDARPRAAALAIYERMRSLERPPPAKDPPVNDPPPDPPRVEPTPIVRPASMRVSAAGVVRFLPRFDDPFLGARAELTFLFQRGLDFELGVDAGIESARADHALGRIDLNLATLGVRLLASAKTDRFIFGAGPALEVGWAWGTGRAGPANTLGRSDSGLVLLAGIELALAFELVSSIWAELALEAGGTVRDFQAAADRQVVIGVSGLFASGSLGVGIDL